MTGDDATPDNFDIGLSDSTVMGIVIDGVYFGYACAICDTILSNPEAKGACPLHGVTRKNSKKNL